MGHFRLFSRSKTAKSPVYASILFDTYVGPHEHDSVSFRQPEQTVKVVQPIGEHASNDLASLPQPHFAIGGLFGYKQYLACGHFLIHLPDKLAKIA